MSKNIIPLNNTSNKKRVMGKKDYLLNESVGIMGEKKTSSYRTNNNTIMNQEKRSGIFKCKSCNARLFSSKAKFNSGTGWPSYFKPITKKAVAERINTSHNMIRTEVICSKCEHHLGHVFKDGPPPTGLRYCIDGEALIFIPKTKT